MNKRETRRPKTRNEITIEVNNKLTPEKKKKDYQTKLKRNRKHINVIQTGTPMLTDEIKLQMKLN